MAGLFSELGRRRWLDPRRWPTGLTLAVAGFTGLVVGTGLGVSASAPQAELAAAEDAFEAAAAGASAERDAALEELDDLELALEERDQLVEQLEEVLEDLEVELQEARGPGAELKDREAELVRRERQLTQQADELEDREAALVARAAELDVRSTELEPTEAARVSFGNGVYEVGADVEAGRYRTQGPSGANPVGCYYARLREPTGGIGNIIDNNIVNGPAVVDLKTGEFFESDSCEVWERS
jgi:multidrug efflux pump subunit AcrA (membrane-fusion protein)